MVKNKSFIKNSGHKFKYNENYFQKFDLKLTKTFSICIGSLNFINHELELDSLLHPQFVVLNHCHMYFQKILKCFLRRLKIFITKVYFIQVVKNPGLWKIPFQLLKNYISLTLEKWQKRDLQHFFYHNTPKFIN